jgi:hypothetical protein
MDTIDSSISRKPMTVFVCKVWEHNKSLHVDAEIVSRSGREKSDKKYN